MNFKKFPVIIVLSFLLELSTSNPVETTTVQRLLYPGEYEEISSNFASLENEISSPVFNQTDDEHDFMPSLARNSTEVKESKLIFGRAKKVKLFQGDMILQPDQEEYLSSNKTDIGTDARTGILQLSYRWPKNKNGYVTLAYEIASYVYSK